jgi:hypothetical protein
MANHKGEPECINCAAYERRGQEPFCRLYSTKLPVGLGPYVVCANWNGPNGKRLDATWVTNHLPERDTLYQFDIYMVSQPKPLMHLGSPKSTNGAAA